MTASGKDFDLDNPYGFEYDIEDIANSLAKICRFNGHINDFYSVLLPVLMTVIAADFNLNYTQFGFIFLATSIITTASVFAKSAKNSVCPLKGIFA